MKNRLLIYVASFLSVFLMLSVSVGLLLGKNEDTGAWAIAKTLYMFSNIILGLIASVISVILLEYTKNRPLKYITDYIIHRKSHEFSISLVITFIVFAVGVYDKNDDMQLFTVIISLCILINHSLTLFRIFTGRFGFNASEMREIISYIETAKNGDFPPGIGGLREPKSRRKSVFVSAQIGSEI